ncbi:hypothetical protein [Paenibacillus spongiae]|uniref:Uncharacterized protein n=1 Tax=Paenibacillus spongiae TaxID=2909671 RepID=A0ABY5S9N0_9BACL|nr:hypothetical protein [Paenibacillus spongiae]UVI30626.1 hypothetical protein L1F29_01740 [Paenibacillus spongiae]
MDPSVRFFMERLIDYAGLFPPAELPLEAAIQNYNRYGHDQDSWMLGRFVVPVSRLGELASYKAMFSEDHPLLLSIVGNRSRSKEECSELLTGSLDRIQTFRNQYQKAVGIDTLEWPLPPVPIGAHLLDAIGRETSKAGLRTFCELTYALDSRWQSNLLEALDHIAAHNSVSEAKIGMKLRTGGVTADAYPAPSQIAIVLEACRDRNIPMKFTAGLHHPVRMYRYEVNAKMHGFLNVFFAGMLAHAHKLDSKSIAEIIEDENPDNFNFTGEGIRWRSLSMTSAEIRSCRKAALSAYGSCSFDEPRDEMRELHKLGQRS